MTLAATSSRPLVAFVSQAPAKKRILETVLELFRAEGIRGVGVDRIIAESSVTKATFYKHYRSKDNLILAYLDAVHEQVSERIERIIAKADDEAAALRGLVTDAIAQVRDPDFAGCPFQNAAVEFAEANHPVRLRVYAHRDWFSARLEQLLRGIGHPAPGDAADELMLALDGAFTGSHAGDAIAASAALDRTAGRILQNV